MRNTGVELKRLDNGCVLHPFLVTMDDPNPIRRAASFLVAGRKNQGALLAMVFELWR